MARQIIKQPNGKYCIFSTISDNVTHYNATPEGIIELWVNESRKTITNTVNYTIKQLENNEKPYDQFTLSYEDMLNTIEFRNGEELAKKVKDLIEDIPG